LNNDQETQNGNYSSEEEEEEFIGKKSSLTELESVLKRQDMNLRTQTGRPKHTKEQSSTYRPAHVPEWKHAEKWACDLYERDKQRETERAKQKRVNNSTPLEHLVSFSN
jgi:hypothetical protein